MRDRLFISDTLKRDGPQTAFGSTAWKTRCRHRTEEEMGFDLLCGGVYKGVT